MCRIDTQTIYSEKPLLVFECLGITELSKVFRVFTDLFIAGIDIFYIYTLCYKKRKKKNTQPRKRTGGFQNNFRIIVNGVFQPF